VLWEQREEEGDLKVGIADVRAHDGLVPSLLTEVDEMGPKRVLEG
jgi:hypothetical protein